MKQLIFIFILLLTPLVLAEDQVIINSKNWQDVSSGLIYANSLDEEVRYIIDESQAIELCNTFIRKDLKDILLIQSNDNFFPGLKSCLEKKGFNVEEFNTKNINLDLGKRLVDKKNIEKFVVVNDKYPYNTISVAPYALLIDGYVLYANQESISDVYDFLDENAQSVLIYGILDRSIKDDLADFNPEIINTGDKFKDNIEITKKFLEINPTKQVLFSNGELLEPSLFNKGYPVLFLGISNIPQQLIDFISDSLIETGIVVGYDLFPNAKLIREITGLKIILKYGQGINAQMYALDFYSLPSSNANILIKEARYNLMTQQLEVVFENKANVYAYVQSIAHNIIVDGKQIKSIGDEKPFFMDSNQTKVKTYNLDLIEYQNKEISMSSNVIFGPNVGSLDNSLTQDTPIQMINLEDNSNLVIEDVVYNQQTARFEITLKNIGPGNVYASPEIEDIIIDSQKTTLSGEIKEIKPNSKETFKIKAQLEQIDFEDNPKIKVNARYGQDKEVLVKYISQEFTFKIKSIVAPVALVILVALVIILLIMIKKKKRKH